MNVLVMNEHGVEYPLWDRPRPPGGTGNPIVDLPGMSASLGRRLQDWNAQFERIALTDFEWESPEVEAAWERHGIALAAELQAELGPEVTVWYQGLGDQHRPITEVTATTSPAADTTEST